MPVVLRDGRGTVAVLAPLLLLLLVTIVLPSF
jgi:hypothetical protein